MELTQYELATAIGIPAPYVSMFETGAIVPKKAKNKIKRWYFSKGIFYNNKRVENEKDDRTTKS